MNDSIGTTATHSNAQSAVIELTSGNRVRAIYQSSRSRWVLASDGRTGVQSDHIAGVYTFASHDASDLAVMGYVSPTKDSPVTVDDFVGHNESSSAPLGNWALIDVDDWAWAWVPSRGEGHELLCAPYFSADWQDGSNFRREFMSGSMMRRMNASQPYARAHWARVDEMSDLVSLLVAPDNH